MSVEPAKEVYVQRLAFNTHGNPFSVRHHAVPRHLQRSECKGHQLVVPGRQKKNVHVVEMTHKTTLCTAKPSIFYSSLLRSLKESIGNPLL